MCVIIDDSGRPIEAGEAGDLVIKLRAENARLREELADREDDIRTEQLWVTHWKEECDKLQEQLAAAQAKLDSLMLEYCPDEMTPEQMDNWAKHQRPATGEQP